MVIFLFGKDTYRARQKMKEIVGQYTKIHKSGLNLKYIDYKEKGSSFDLRDDIRQASMFKEKKLVVLRNPFADSEFKQELLEQLDKFAESEDIFLIYEEGKINASLLKSLKKKAKCQEFELLTNAKLKEWVKKEFIKRKIKIELSALEELVKYVGNDLWRFSNEIDKLTSFKNQGEVEVKDVKLLVRATIETDIFSTIDAIAQKNKKQALKLLHQHLEKGDSAFYILSMIAYQFRNLLIIKELIEKHDSYDAILKKSGLHPFVVRKSYGQCQHFSLEELKKIYQKIFQVDLGSKIGKVRPEAALDLFIAEI